MHFEESIYKNIYIIIISIILLILFFNLILLINNIKLKNRINKILGCKKNKNINDIEFVIKEYYNKVLFLESKYDEISNDIEKIYKKICNCIQKIAIIRYNPFNNMGGDLSYVLAMLDENNNGFIINTIFNREDSMTYCKPIRNGSSSYKLSYEEKCVIKKAMGLEDKKIRGSKDKKNRD